MPTTVVVALALLPALRRGVVEYAFWLSMAGFLAVTVTPNPNSGRARTLSLTPDVPGLHQMLTTADQSGLNADIAVPMGLLAVVLARSRRRPWPVLLAVVVPPLAEGVQWLLPSLGRVAFQFGDVTANWTGVLLGSAVGLAISLLADRLSGRSGRASRRAARS